MTQVALSTESAALPDVVPWGWRDIVRAILLSIVSLVVLFVVLVVAIVIRFLAFGPLHPGGPPNP
jgi:hypothetical protein